MATTLREVTVSAVDVVAAANSVPIDVRGCDTFSIQAVIDENTDTAKTFDSGVAAVLVNQSLTYTALVRGSAGNAITVRYLNSGVPSQALAISTVGTAITATLALDAGVAATLVVQDLTYLADVAGVAGNSITIEYIADGVAGAETVNVTGNHIVVHMSATPVIGSTANQIKTAVNASAPASALISVSGASANVQAAAAETALATGAAPLITSTGDAVKAAVNLNAGAAALILVSGSNGSAVTALSATPLATGVDSEVSITADSVTIPSHGFPTGMLGRLTSTGTLPAGVTTGVDYFVIALDANTIQFADSLVHAQAGTALDLTDQGSSAAVNTFTPTALAGATIKFQKSNDYTNWTDIAVATTITVDTSVWLDQTIFSYGWVRSVLTITAGSMTVDMKILLKSIVSPPTLA